MLAVRIAALRGAHAEWEEEIKGGQPAVEARCILGAEWRESPARESFDALTDGRKGNSKQMGVDSKEDEEDYAWKRRQGGEEGRREGGAREVRRDDAHTLEEDLHIEGRRGGRQRDAPRGIRGYVSATTT